MRNDKAYGAAGIVGSRNDDQSNRRSERDARYWLASIRLERPISSIRRKGNLSLAALSKAAAMCRSVISNHPFIDGNKRTGIHVMLIFLEVNGVQPDYTQEELIDLGLGIAAGNLDVNDILNWLSEHCK